jgi:hypothetical protein
MTKKEDEAKAEAAAAAKAKEAKAVQAQAAAAAVEVAKSKQSLADKARVGEDPVSQEKIQREHHSKMEAALATATKPDPARANEVTRQINKEQDDLEKRLAYAAEQENRPLNEAEIASIKADHEQTAAKVLADKEAKAQAEFLDANQHGVDHRLLQVLYRRGVINWSDVTGILG